MDKQSLYFTSIHVRKMPGLPDGLKPMENLSGQVNIIAGPNASGKTSTATAIRQLLWPSRSARMVIDGSAATPDALWELRMEYGHFQAQRDGSRGELPGLPAADESSRYNFALQDLVHINDQDLAAKIYQEAMGGYNLGSATSALRYSPDIKKRNIGAYSSVQAAEARVIKTTTEQRELKDKEQQIFQWTIQRDQAANALKLKGLYEALVDCMVTSQVKDDLDDRLSAYPAQLAGLSGNEYEQLTKLDEQIVQLNSDRAGNTEEIREQEEALSKLGLPEQGISPQWLFELEERVEQLTAAERESAEAGITVAGLIAKLEELKEGIKPGYQPGDLLKTDLNKIVKLDEFVASAHKLLSQVRYLEAAAGSLEGRPAPVSTDTDQLKLGIKTLISWLGEQRDPGGVPLIRLWLTAAGAVCAILATALWGWWGTAGLLLPVLIALLPVRANESPNTAVREADFKGSGLKQPRAWRREEVQELVAELNVELQKAELYGLETSELDRLSNELGLLQPELKKIEQQRNNWIQLLGHAPALPEGDLKNYSSFYFYVRQLSEYAHAAAGLALEQGVEEEAGKRVEATLKKINVQLEEFQLSVQDGPAAKAVFKSLSDKENQRKNIVTAIDGLNRLDKEHSKQLEEANLLLEAIYEKLKLEKGDVHGAFQLVSQLTGYQELAAGCQEKKTLLAEKERALKGQEAYSAEAEKLAGLDMRTAQARLDKLIAEGAGLETLNEKIISTNALVAERQAGHDLEDALAGKEAALDELQQVFEDNLSAMTGSLLVAYLKQEGAESNSSKVLSRGNQLFNQITSGRYELKINDADQLNFLAYDHALRQGQGLDQLSSGTRIQLLLCIRLAYIESQEKEQQIPIIADELLANSDEQRSMQIIEALAGIASAGRQVFYFTAQKEEIAKWHAYAATKPGLQLHTYVLGGDEPKAYPEEDEQPFSLQLFENVPAAGDHDHESYGKMIGIPGFRLMDQQPEQLHLWYLLESPQDIETCLERRIFNYGQLHSYIKHGGALAGMDQGKLDSMEKKVALLATYQELYQQGKPRRINLEGLKESGAVTDRFLEPVLQVLKEVAYDPERLIRELNHNAVPGFRATNKERLEEFLSQEGYLGEGQAVSADDMVALLQIRVDKLGLAAVEAQNFLDLVIGS